MADKQANKRVDIFLTGNNYDQALEILMGLPDDADVLLLAYHYFVIAEFIRMSGHEYPYELI